jgi:CRISPR type I-E-associated protein CasB/Cse2
MPKRKKEFIQYLVSHREDKAMMADLRRGFSLSMEYRAWPYIASWCDITDEKERRAYVTVGAGFGLIGETSEKGNMGSVFLEIVRGSEKNRKRMESFDARFRRCLFLDSSEELCPFIAGIIRAAKHREVKINFHQLLIDLIEWGEKVKVRWASNFWGEEKTDLREK